MTYVIINQNRYSSILQCFHRETSARASMADWCPPPHGGYRQQIPEVSCSQLSYNLERKMSGKLEGKVAIVTGGSSGIGLATAQRFVAEGAYVFITGRRQAELDAAGKTIGKKVTGGQGDVADLDKLYDVVKKEKGRVDILFANAGGGEFAPLGSITEEHFDKTFNANVKGLLFSVQKALPLFSDGGSIILNASIVSMKGLPALSVYSATKAAVRSFARGWTLDLK